MRRLSSVPSSPTASARSLTFAWGAALALLGAPAAAQIPPMRTNTESSLPPMPAPQPIVTTPPDVGAIGSATPTGPQPSPPTPAGMPGPTGGLPNVDTRAVPPPGNTSTSEPVTATSTRPEDRYGVGGPAPRRGWGAGSTLLNRDSRVGVYIAPTFKLASINRSPALMLGADFAVLIAERFAVGAAGSALVTPLPALRSDGRTFNLRTQYAGITLGVALVRVKFFSLSLGGLIGGGRACLNDERLDRCVNRAAMFVAEPELGFSFALTKVLRLVLSGGYRFAVVQAWSGPSDRLLGGPTGTLALRLGKF
jgi:hypothetical protein